MLLPLALPLASGLVLNHASLLRFSSHETGLSPVLMGGKGFGGGEATRDPAPTSIDPNDPKGKQQAIHNYASRFVSAPIIITDVSPPAPAFL